jgi:amidohydrolase
MNKITQAVNKYRKLIRDSHEFIWTHAETGYKEVQTSKYMEEVFESLGYELQKAGNIPGFITVLETGKPGPDILILGEMDSLICKEHPDANPETGAVHCCGHSMQSAALIGIAAALKEPEMLDDWCGRIRLCAVPAEELLEVEYRQELMEKGIIHYLGGKTEFLYRGYFDGVDLAFMVHSTVSDNALVTPKWNGCISKRIIYKGISAHAGGAPWNGCNALYAANLGLNAINAIRETFEEKDLIRVHPIITKGGNVVNAIPDEVVLESYVRGISLEAIKKVNKRVNRALCGAALSLGANIDIQDLPGYAPFLNCNSLIDVVEEAVEHIPDMVFKRNEFNSTGSTDMGDLSAVMPTVQPCLPGPKGILHGANFVFPDAEKACVDSAIVQIHMLDILLRNGATRAQKVIDEYVPEFASKEEFFAFIDGLRKSGNRIVYTDTEVKIEL